MINRHSRVRDGHSLPQHLTPTTLPLGRPSRYVADGEGHDTSGGAATAFVLLVIVAGWIAAALIGR
ncbi:MAG: hypothetical protein ACLGJC_09080 [Alphaproteobacteria bacterium]